MLAPSIPMTPAEPLAGLTAESDAGIGKGHILESERLFVSTCMELDWSLRDCLCFPGFGKADAIRAYFTVYYTVAAELERRYPERVKVLDMKRALGDAETQREMLEWCGFAGATDGVRVDTTIQLNKGAAAV